MAAKGAYLNNSVDAAVRVKADYADVRMISVVHANSADHWLQMFDANTLSAVTLGTTAPDYSIPIPAAAGGVRGKFFEVFPEGTQLEFMDGLVIALTTTSKGSTDATLKGVVNLKVL